jgi:predicted nucleic acid-binding protein
VLAAIEATEPEPLVVPATVLGKLYFGARKSGRAAENTRRIERFASEAEMLPSQRCS